MTGRVAFHRDILQLDPAQEVERIVNTLRNDVFNVLKRKGGVLGVSGGVDSAVVLALAVRALGAERLVALLLPEMESSPESAELARRVCRQFDVEPIVEDVTGPLIGFGCYRRRDEAVQAIFPEYDSTYKLGYPERFQRDHYQSGRRGENEAAAPRTVAADCGGV